MCRIDSFLCNLIGSFVAVLWQRLKIDGLPDTALEKEARKCVPSCEVNRLHKNSRNVNHSPLSVVVCIKTSIHINNKIKEWQLIYLAGISVRCLASMYDKPYNMLFFLDHSRNGKYETKMFASLRISTSPERFYEASITSGSSRQTGTLSDTHACSQTSCKGPIITIIEKNI